VLAGCAASLLCHAKVSFLSLNKWNCLFIPKIFISTFVVFVCLKCINQSFLQSSEDRRVLLWGACDLVRQASNAAFGAKKRGMIATDVIEALPQTMQHLYPV
jgi:NAD(P)H-hydrate repair Nnr-like enzyme with NAD(P)H-hydrate dehydratase domain